MSAEDRGPTIEADDDRFAEVDRRLEQIDLCLTEVRVFLEELMDRQARHGLEGWTP